MNSARKLNRLIDETEELLAELPVHCGADVNAVRDRLAASLERTKSALGQQRDEDGASQHLKVRHVAASVNDYVKGYPWLALATGVLVASTIGILATSATKRSYSHDA